MEELIIFKMYRATVLGLIRSRKDLPEEARAWLQLISCEDQSLVGKKVILCSKSRPSIRKHELVRLEGKLTKIRHRPAIEVRPHNIVPDFTSSSLQALRRMKIDMPEKSSLEELMKQKNTVRLADVIDEIELTSDEKASAYITQISAIQHLFDEANLELDFDKTAEIYDTLRFRAARNEQDVLDFIRDNPWVIVQIESIRYKTAEKLAKHLKRDTSKLAIYAFALSCIWNAARKGDCYIPFVNLYNMTRNLQKRYNIKLTFDEFKDLLISGKSTFGSRYGKACLCSSTKYAESVYADRLNCYEHNAEKEAEKDKRAVYTNSAFFSEKDAAKRLACHTVSQVEDLTPKVMPYIAGNLDPYQEQAIKTTLKNPFSIWAGHAGSGKTYASRLLAKAAKDAGIPIAILAPTAVAADRASSSLGIKGKTIHRYTGIKPEEDDLLMTTLNSEDENDTYVENITIVDEVSMCDITALAHLACIICPGTHLVLIGDPAQLPAVGPSGFFQQIIRNKPNGIPLCYLKSSHRSKDDICNFANIIRTEGKVINPESDRIKFVPGGIEEVILQAQGLKDKPLDDIMIMAPLREDTRELNAKLQILWNSAGELIEDTDFRVGDPVICFKNDYADGKDAYRHKNREIDIYNGYRGIITEQDEDNFWVRFTTPEGPVEVPYTKYEAKYWLELAYAVTVHKAQGGEAKYAILLVTEKMKKMGKAMFYTAVTRASEQLIIVGGKEDIHEAARKTSVPPRTKFLQRFEEKLSYQTFEEDDDVKVHWN
jgi:exodeoxyribonuclease V alpha subunit